MKRTIWALIYTVIIAIIIVLAIAALLGIVYGLIQLGPLALLAIPLTGLFCMVYDDTDEEGDLHP
jgi:uncharacterized membrane protein